MLTETMQHMTLAPYSAQNEDYLRSCQQTDEFSMFVGSLPSDKNSCFVLCCKDQPIGCAVIIPIDLFGIDYAAISVYISNEHRMLSALAIRLVANHAASLSKKPERLLFLVHGDNLQCIALMERIGIECAVEFPRVTLRNQHYVSLRYYIVPLDECRTFASIFNSTTTRSS